MSPSCLPARRILRIFYILSTCCFLALAKPIQDDTDEKTNNDGYSIQPRIVGGFQSGEAVHWMASINNNKEKNAHYCGGVLVSPDYVLTAAHCFNPYTANREYLSHTVFLGKSKFNGELSYQHKSKIKSITCHPDFDRGSSANDVCLVKLRIPAKDIRTPRINWDSSIPEFQQEVFYLGYGVQLQNSEDMSDNLRMVNVRTTSYKQCSDTYGTKQITYKHICTYSNFKDTCQGDSGSPLLQQGGDRTLANGLVLGLVSYGRGCAIPGFPAVNVRISVYTDWINEIVREGSDDEDSIENVQDNSSNWLRPFPVAVRHQPLESSEPEESSKTGAGTRTQDPTEDSVTFTTSNTTETLSADTVFENSTSIETVNSTNTISITEVGENNGTFAITTTDTESPTN